jgi:predicted Zn-dependent protease with MMP-like domain
MERKPLHQPNRARLERIADAVIRQMMRRLPSELRQATEQCAIELAWGAELEADSELLGYFDGRSCLDPAPESADELPRILLFLDHLWEFSDRSVPTFENEVATTLLHELGHYLGWSEEEIAQRGLE